MASTYPATNDLPQNASIAERWLLDEASGTRAGLVNSHDLTDNNTVGAGTGYSAPGASFDNAADFELDNSEYLSVADHADFDITGDMTFSAFVKPESQPATNEGFTFYSKWGPADADRTILIEYRDLSGVNYMRVAMGDGLGSEANGTVAQTLSNGTWYHVTYAYDASAGDCECYVDGSSVGTISGLYNSLVSGAGAVHLGSLPGGALYHDGLMNDAIVWSYRLSDTEVSDLYDLYQTAAGASGSPIFFT